MTAQHEIELKLRVDPENLPALRRSGWWRGLGKGRRKTLHSIYFDTPDRLLLRLGIALRVRLDGSTVVQTIKMGVEGANAMVRREWEAIVPDAVPDPTLVIDPALPRAFRELTSLDVEPVFEVKVIRDIRRVMSDETDIEIAVDSGTVICGSKAADINEIELEVKSGDQIRLFEIARQINEVIPTRLHMQTKSDAGYGLHDRNPRQWIKGEIPALGKGMSAGESLSAIVDSCLHHLIANDSCARENRHKEGVHQCRVALRRMHSAFKIYEKVLPEGALGDLGTEVRWFAKSMGPARDLDVVQDELLMPMIEELHDSEGVSALIEQAKSLEAEAYRTVDDALSSRRYGRMLIDLCAFGEAREWETTTGAARAGIDASTVDFAKGALTILHRKLLKRGRKFEKLSTTDRHRVRIAVKKMRYAVEFFGNLFEPKRRKRYSKSLSRLQDDLGRLNDVAMAEDMLDQLSGGTGGEIDRELIIAAGRVLGWHQRRATEIDAKLVKDWYAFAETDPFWSGKKN